MTTWVPIHVCMAEKSEECLWRLGKVREQELVDALKMLLLLSITDRTARDDFLWIVAEVGTFAKELCEKTEIHLFCVIASRLGEK